MAAHRATLTDMIAAGDLAEELGVDPGDVPVLLAQLGAQSDPISDDLGADIRDQLNHFG